MGWMLCCSGHGTLSLGHRFHAQAGFMVLSPTTQIKRDAMTFSWQARPHGGRLTNCADEREQARRATAALALNPQKRPVAMLIADSGLHYQLL